MLPKPTIPSRRPRASWPVGRGLVPDAPGCICASLPVMPARSRAIISARASSTTLRVLEYGALNAAIPRRRRRRRMGDLVRADAERADGHQVGRVLENTLRDVCAGSDAEHLDAAARLPSPLHRVHRGDQLVLVQRPRPRLHLVAVASRGVTQRRDRNVPAARARWGSAPVWSASTPFPIHAASCRPAIQRNPGRRPDWVPPGRQV